MSTDTATTGRLLVFVVLKSFKLLGLKANATAKDADAALKSITHEIHDGIMPGDEAETRLTEATEAHEVVMSFIDGPLKPATKEAADDWVRFYGVYTTYLDSKTDKEKEELKKCSDEAQLSLLDADLVLKPLVYGVVRTSARDGLATSWAIVILGIPVLIFLWNLHPVVGILGIVWYLWLLRDRWVAGQF
jgi:hypothetical protein